MNTSKRITIAVACVSLSGLIFGCGKSVGIGSRPVTLNPQDNKSSPPNMGTSSNGNPYIGTSGQSGQAGKSGMPLDILFLVDSSSLGEGKRTKIAADITRFVKKVPVGVDYQVALMLAPATESSWSGRLFSVNDSPEVFNPASMPNDSFETTLASTLEQIPTDNDVANRDASVDSILQSLDTDHLQEIQKQGFYRNNAGLTVVFITDKTDISPEHTLSRLKAFKGAQPVTVESLKVSTDL